MHRCVRSLMTTWTRLYVETRKLTRICLWDKQYDLGFVGELIRRFVHWQWCRDWSYFAWDTCLFRGNLSHDERRKLIDEIKDAKKKRLNGDFLTERKKWWDEKREQILSAPDINNSKFFYNLLHVVYGPLPSPVNPLCTKDGNTLIRNPADILKRWCDILLSCWIVLLQWIRDYPVEFLKDLLKISPLGHLGREKCL